MPLALVGLLAAAGCAQLDPLTKEGVWRPTGANDANLRAMVAVPGDLAYGRAARTADGNTAARAVNRLRTGRVYQLPEVTTSTFGGGGGGGGAPAPAVAPE